MCGIAGIVGIDGTTIVGAAEIRDMCAAIIHRGPDDEGVYTNGAMGMGMRRLSIIDVASGQQPVHNEERDVWVVFNGELYNFQELRIDLQARGHVFYTKSDTEVIVHLYETYGSMFINKLRGMFAFALYDLRHKKLLLGRDRLGKKPLHYALHNGTMYFGSEIKSLLAVAPTLAAVDQEAIAQFFYYGYIPDPSTAFTAVKKLPPGYYLEFANGSIHLKQYWDVPPFCSAVLSEDESLDRLETTLENAVRMRMVSEVPLGALLSGGVDSSTIVAMMSRISDRPVKTFSIGFSHADFDELNHARAVAVRFGTDHHELVIDADLWETLNTVSAILDEPFADSSVIPTYHVARLAREHVTVALSGDGGDEVFAGYDNYLVNYRRRYLNLIPAWVAPVYHKFVYPLLPRRIRNRRLAYNIVQHSCERFVSGRVALQSYDDTLAILSPEFLRSVSCGVAPGTIIKRCYTEAPATDLISRMQYADIKTYLAGDILTKVDRMSMACSLEMRCPLLDHVFVEFATRLPVSMKIRNGTQKYLLRRLAERLGVPREVLYRPKQGFALPLKHWMRAELKGEIASLLLEPRTLQRGYFRRSAIERLLMEHHRAERDNSAALWQLLSFELWHRNYLERRAIPSAKTSSVPCA